VAWGRALRLEPVALASGQQTFRLEGSLRGERLTGEVRASRVDLARLPKVLVPATLGLAGIVTLEGMVQSWTQRADAERVVRGLAGVRGVINQITVAAKPIDPTRLRELAERWARTHAKAAE
jgi:hypothetical protein